MKAADVSLHIAASADNLTNVVLNVSAKSLPFTAATAKSRNIVKVAIRLLTCEKLIAVVESVFVAGAVHQPKLAVPMSLGVVEKPMHHSAKGRDPRAGS